MLSTPPSPFEPAPALIPSQANLAAAGGKRGRWMGVALGLACALALAGCGSAGSASGSDSALKAGDVKPTTMNLGGGNKAELASAPTDIGIEIYPGAVPAAAPGSTISGPEGSIKIASYTTKDSIDQVFDYYKPKFPADAVTSKFPGGNHNMATLFRVAGKSRLTLTITRQDGADTTALDIKNVTEN